MIERNPDRYKRAEKARSAARRVQRLACAQARRRRVRQQTPEWADVAKTKQIYARAVQLRAEGHDVEVEHVVPLKGRNVSGLHVHTNLEIRSKSFNRKKGNKHEP